jgi:hypothetical protein
MYLVVGCSNCSGYWVTEEDQDTSMCRRCGKRHQLDRLKRFIRTDDIAVAREKRARLLAEKAGFKDEYESASEHFD